MLFLKLSLILQMTLVLTEPNDDDDTENTTTDGIEDEWHMDFIPVGHPPDNVYRELAWYGILQIEPLHHSYKHKAAAHLIWQNTLSRPHVIMESVPQSTASPGKASRQMLSEEGAKWSREQRSTQEVIMDTIKTGGNGITIRTVVGAAETTTLIIQSGTYYWCPSGSSPDYDAFREQTNTHVRKCTEGYDPKKKSYDPCIDAETAPIEYSYGEGWMFCFGNGDREVNYFQNGTVDCGKKHKWSVKQFLDVCAIDNNIVITYEYYGDEPRKDLLHNKTICDTWDPCRLSYLYRLEPPDEFTPLHTSTTENPCETTICDDCIEGFSDDGEYSTEIKINIEE